MKTALLSECARLKKLMKYNGKDGFYYWPHVCDRKNPDYPSQCGICTNGAKIIAWKFHGYVAGYHIHPEESRSLVAADVDGHDFAVIGDFIVDWWGWEYERSLMSPVIRREEGIRLGKYKPEDAWEVFPFHDFRKQPAHRTPRTPESL